LRYRKEPIQLGAHFREAYPNVLLIINRPWHNSSIHLLLWNAKGGVLTIRLQYLLQQKRRETLRWNCYYRDVSSCTAENCVPSSSGRRQWDKCSKFYT